MSMWQQLKQRSVLAAGAAYLVFAWVLIEVVTTVSGPLGLPGWVDSAVIVLLAAGFPVVLVLSWVFDISPSNNSTGRPVNPVIVKAVGFTTALILLVAVLTGAHRWVTGQWIFAKPGFSARLGNQQLLSTFPGSHTQPSVSPDGSLMAVVSDASGVPQIWAKNLAEGDPIQVTDGDVPSLAPCWSPNNDQILFHRPNDGIWTVGPLGSPKPRRLIESGLNVSFSNDGRSIVFEHGRDLFVADADGGNIRQVEGMPERFISEVAASPSWSPDGQWIAFFLQSDGPLGDIWVLPTSGGEARRLTFDSRQAATPIWTPDGRYIIFSSRRGGSQTLWAVPFEGGEVLPVTNGIGEDSTPVLNHGAQNLLYSNVRTNYSLEETDPFSGTTHTIYQSRYGIYLPKASPDGRHIVFFSDTAAGVHIFVIDRDGQNLEQLTHGADEFNIHPRFSANGDSVYYYQNFPEHSLRKLPLAGGRDEWVFQNFTWQTHNLAQEDPSGRYLALTRMEPPDWSKDRNLIIDLATGEEHLFADGHIHGAEWSNDGQKVLGARDRGQLALCPVDGRPCVHLGGGEAPLRGSEPMFSADGTHIFYRRSSTNPSHREIWQTTTDGDKPQKLMEYGPVEGLNDTFDTTLEDTLVWVRYERGNDEIWMADFTY